jgi:two-component system CheB/CheR fusion protein
MRTTVIGTGTPQQESQSEQNDDTIVSPFHPFPLVGIGASAGGLQALQHFFTHMPADSGMAFVVIMHLSPTHESHVASLLQHTTKMPVIQVTEAVHVAPNHVYVIPPTQDLSMVDGSISLQEREASRAGRAPIDLFFRTLAETHGHSAAAIVLSGSGADGASGVERVKERGGVTLVQEPEEAEYASMPRSAIATGLIDYILPVTELPDALVTYWRNAASVRLQDPGAVLSTAVPSPDAGEALREIFVLLHTHTKHDFSQYKRTTVLRRIGRRMQVHGVADLPAYVVILRAELDEVQALLRDLLISVTNFFRDPQAWLTLEALLPQIFADKQANDQVRVWVAGCATGEEAYTIAMLLAEYAATVDQPPRIQVFATDIDEHAISAARQGLYRETIATDVSPERLARFFVAEQGGYRIKREIRDMVLFAVHNLLHDPPFSRLDLITCRNLLIYLNRDVQAQVLQLFHVTLQPNGYLLLGTSESFDGVPSLFTVIDKSQRLFRHRTAPDTLPAMLPNKPFAESPKPRVIAGGGGDSGSTQVLADVHQQLLAHYAPPSVLVNQDYEIVRISRGGERFLEFTEGQLSTNVLKLIRPSLRIELRTALFQAFQQDGPAETRRVSLDVQGASRLVSLLVQPVREPDWMRGYAMVIFHEIANISSAEPSAVGDAEPLVRQLEEELQRTKDQLRTMIEQYETADEEHKASNEELQAINEELRATTEELETSKEELQSINEELTTINQEMKHKVEALGQANNDLQNLMASTQIGTIFVDRDLQIRRYTASAQALFNLIPSDVNRPLAHITHKLDYDELAADVARVLSTLAWVEREVQSQEGCWYLVRLLPYRTLEDRIDGVTLTFVDITHLKQVEAERERLLEAVQQARAYAEQIVETVRDPLLVLDAELRVQTANQAFYQLFQVTPGKTEHTLLYELGDGQWDQAQLRALLSAALMQHIPVQDFEVTQTFPLLGARTMRLNARQIEHRPDQPGLLLLAIEDITIRRQAADALRDAHDSLETQVQERTGALVAANAALQAEIGEHKRTQQMRQLLLHQLLTTQEEERRHIARELHDQMGQDLTALLLEIKALQDAAAADTLIASRVAQVQVLTLQISAEVRTLALQLHPPALDHMGLVATLTNYVEEWSARALTPVEFHTSGLDSVRLPAMIELALYRLVQECLTNILKHAQASDVSLIIERRVDAVRLIVEDDGVGFDIAAAQQSAHVGRRLGLVSMQERVAQLGGTITIESEPGRGTTIIVRIPFADAAAGEADGTTSDLSGR